MSTTNPLPPTVSVIIPNWNGAHHLPDCLGGLERQHYADFEVILVDNGSRDESLKLLAREYPWVRVIALPQNRGFAPACNVGLGAARGEILVLLNNDTEADPGWLNAVVDAFRRHAEAGAVASKMRLFDRRDHLHTAGDIYRLDGTPGNRGAWQRDEGQFDAEAYVFSACGGAAAYRRAMLEQVGGLDESFYFSCEDVDLGWRAQMAGWPCVYSPHAVVYHKVSATGAGVINSYYDGRNFIHLIVKNYPGALLRRHWREVLRAQWRITRDALRAWRGEAARARLRGQLAGLLGLPRMLSARRKVQRERRISDEELLRVLAPVGD
jgi:GT2 family glycosyltransferase